jgi:hypothetical protein
MLRPPWTPSICLSLCTGSPIPPQSQVTRHFCSCQDQLRVTVHRYSRICLWKLHHHVVDKFGHSRSPWIILLPLEKWVKPPMHSVLLLQNLWHVLKGLCSSFHFYRNCFAASYVDQQIAGAGVWKRNLCPHTTQECSWAILIDDPVSCFYDWSTTVSLSPTHPLSIVAHIHTVKSVTVIVCQIHSLQNSWIRKCELMQTSQRWFDFKFITNHSKQFWYQGQDY